MAGRVSHPWDSCAFVNLFSLVMTARANGLELFEYLCECSSSCRWPRRWRRSKRYCHGTSGRSWMCGEIGRNLRHSRSGDKIAIARAHTYLSRRARLTVARCLSDIASLRTELIWSGMEKKSLCSWLPSRPPSKRMGPFAPKTGLTECSRPDWRSRRRTCFRMPDQC